MGDGDGVDVRDGEFGISECLVDDWQNGLDVGTGGNLRNHAAIGRVDVDLRNDYIRQNSSLVGNDCAGGFVAGALNG